MTDEQVEETFDYRCPRLGCGFTSTKWPTAEQRDARGAQHENEHDTGEVMPELAVFLGYAPDPRDDQLPSDEVDEPDGEYDEDEEA